MNLVRNTNLVITCFLALLSFGSCQYNRDIAYYENIRNQIADSDLRLTEVIGVYISSWEVSAFSPCGIKETWWLENLTRKTSQALDLDADEIALVKIEARITPDEKAGVIGDQGTWLRHEWGIERQDAGYVFQGYGHLGQYDREVYVEKVLERQTFQQPDFDYDLDFETRDLQRNKFYQSLCPAS